jgi:hypothetical protein
MWRTIVWDAVQLPDQRQWGGRDVALLGQVQFHKLAPRMGHAAYLDHPL